VDALHDMPSLLSVARVLTSGAKLTTAERAALKAAGPAASPAVVAAASRPSALARTRWAPRTAASIPRSNVAAVAKRSRPTMWSRACTAGPGGRRGTSSDW
jgi:hypothetical protein